MNAVVPMLTSALHTLVEFEPEIALAIEALTTHKVDREAFNQAVRDLILKTGEARMRAEFPGEDP
jgi:hypothetical protein